MQCSMRAWPCGWLLIVVLPHPSSTWSTAFVNWQRSLPPALGEVELTRGVAHAGDRQRLSGVLRDLLSGRPIHFAVVGGSISAGSTLGIQHRNAEWLWHGQFFQWLNSSFPHSGHRRYNGAVPASTPGYVTACLSFHVPSTVQLVIVEYSVNTQDAREYERLVRRLLAYPNRPAIILLHMFKWWSPHKGRGFSPGATIDASDLDFQFIDAHIESAANEMAQYYGLASLSMRNALFHKVRRNDSDGLRLTDFMIDRIHPNIKGNALAAQLLVSFISSELNLLEANRMKTALRASSSLLAEQKQHLEAESERTASPSSSFADITAEYFPNPLPPPVYPFNTQDDDSNAEVCVRGKEMLEHTLSHEGWDYVVEGTASNPKPGLKAVLPNKRLEICWSPPSFNKPVSFKLGYLKTYGSTMGTANMSCKGQCSCSSLTLDGNVPGKPRSRDRVSMHHVENIVLHPRHARGHRRPLNRNGRIKPQASEITPASKALEKGDSTQRRAGRTDENCCIVAIETLPAKPRALSKIPGRYRGDQEKDRLSSPETVGTAFKVLSFFVGTSAAGTGRLHQQSIIMDLPGGAQARGRRG